MCALLAPKSEFCSAAAHETFRAVSTEITAFSYSAVQVLMSNFTDSAVQFLKSEFVVKWFYPDFHVFCLAQFFFYMLNYLAVFVESFLVRVNHI